MIQRLRDINPTIVVREAGLQDGAQFVALFNKYYKRETNVEYFRWQFFNGPTISKLFLALDEGKLIGYYGVKIYELTNGTSAGFVIDLLVDEGYRKRGIAYLLNEEVVQFSNSHQASVMAGLPNAFGNASLNAMGWKTIAKIDDLVAADFEIASVPTALHNPGKSLVEFARNENYRHWRFRENPLYTYKEICVDKNNYAVTKLFKNPSTDVVVNDLVDFKFDEISTFSVLLSRVLEQMKEDKTKTITTWALPHTAVFSFLTRAGFRISPQARYFCLKLLDINRSELYQIENWNLVQADAEIY